MTALASRACGLLVALWVGWSGSGCSAMRPATAVGEFAGRSVGCDELQAYATEASALGASPAGERPGAVELFESLVVARMLEAEARRLRLAESPAFLARWTEVRQNILRESLEVDPFETEFADVDTLPPVQALNAPRFDDSSASVRIIFKALPTPASAATRRATADLRALQAQFLSGVPFADLARRHSEHASAAVGGALTAAAQAEFGVELARVIAPMEAGELSDVVRLANGVALVLFEGRDAAAKATALAVQPPPARATLEQRAERFVEERARRRAHLLDEARRSMRTRLVTEALAATEDAPPVVHIDDDAFTLAQLGLERRPPLLREAVQLALEEEMLARLAERRASPAVTAELEAARRHLLAEMAMEELLRRRFAADGDVEARRRYDLDAARFQRDAQRVLEVIRIAADSADLADSRAAATAIARIWRPDGPAHHRTRSEIWGPLSQAELAAYTSAELAQQAFVLPPESIGEPVLVELPGREGRVDYIVFRVRDAVPAGPIPFAEARDRLVDEAARGARPEQRAEVRARILQQANVRLYAPLLECDLAPMPIERAVEFGGAPETRQAPERRPSPWGRSRGDRRAVGAAP